MPQLTLPEPRYSLRTVGSRIGIGYQTVKRIARELGISTKSRGGVPSLTADDARRIAAEVERRQVARRQAS